MDACRDVDATTADIATFGRFRSKGGEDRVAIARVNGTVFVPSMKDWTDCNRYDTSGSFVRGKKDE